MSENVSIRTWLTGESPVKALRDIPSISQFWHNWLISAPVKRSLIAYDGI